VWLLLLLLPALPGVPLLQPQGTVVEVAGRLLLSCCLLLLLLWWLLLTAQCLLLLWQPSLLLLLLLLLRAVRLPWSLL
jgi:hypothetical protein